MQLLKFVFAVTLAVGSVLAFVVVRGRPSEKRFYAITVVMGILFKFIGCILVYSLFPYLNEDSDAVLYYFPKTLEVLEGKIPYRDFPSSYSPLFHFLLAGPVFLWRSVGAVVLTMLAAETVMLIIYLRLQRRRDDLRGWQTAFLYSFSPISVYWVAVTGYNGSLIGFFVLAALVLAEKGKSFLSGVGGACSFLFCKLLAVLSWAGIVFYSSRGWFARVIAPGLALIFIAVLALVGVDALYPLRHELPRSTAGSLWYIVAKAIPGLETGAWWQILPILAFGVIFGLLFVLFLRNRPSAAERHFDYAVAFIAATNLLFLMVSKKVYPSYVSMSLIFIVHTITLDDRSILRGLIPLAILGATTTLQPTFSVVIARGEGAPGYHQAEMALLLVSIAILACYAILLVLCSRSFVLVETSGEGPRDSAGRSLGEERTGSARRGED